MSYELGLHTQLRQSLKGVTHESVDVRLHALSKLRDLLHKNRASSVINFIIIFDAHSYPNRLSIRYFTIIV